MKIIKNHNGQALIIVLILGAIIAALAPALHAMLSARSFEAADRQRQNLMKNFIRDVQLAVLDAKECTKMLRDFNLGSIGLLPNKKRVVVRWDTGASQLNLQQNTDLPNYFIKLSDVQLETSSRALRSDGITPRRIIYDWPKATAPSMAFEKYYGELIFVPENMRWNINLPENRIKIAFIFNPATESIHQCHGVPSPAEACEVAGGAYDALELSPLGLECNPQLSCFTFATSRTENLIVNSAAGCLNLYRGPEQHLYINLYKPHPIGAHLDGTGTFLCNWCNRGL